ncbi:MAG: type I restriction enzyme M protein, partial [Gammaproteobacteria bacterium]
FGSSKAHQQLREELIENNQLEGIISLPSGVFKPYAGVSTAILLFTKGGETDQVWFYDVQADGYSLDDKRAPMELNDLPDVMAQYGEYRKQRESHQPDYSEWRDKRQKAFLVDKTDIAANKYDLSINRYKEVVYEEEVYEPPKVILKKLQKLEEEIVAELFELEEML